MPEVWICDCGCPCAKPVPGPRIVCADCAGGDHPDDLEYSEDEEDAA